MYILKKKELNKLLFKKKLNRASLSKGAGISIETINSWLYRDSMATRETATKVANFLAVDISDIFDGVK